MCARPVRPQGRGHVLKVATRRYDALSNREIVDGVPLARDCWPRLKIIVTGAAVEGGVTHSRLTRIPSAPVPVKLPRMSRIRGLACSMASNR